MTAPPARAATTLLLGSLLLTLGACSSHSARKIPPTLVPYRSVAAALRARLDQQQLSYRWVACTTMNLSFRGRRVSRCNVNFGAPHIVPYCAVLVDGKLITDHENQAVSCGSRTNADEQDK